LSLIQGLFQALGVTSIFPFLAVAAAPEKLRNSEIGSYILEQMPSMTNQQLLLATGAVAVCMLIATSGLTLYSEYYRATYTQMFGHWLRIQLLRRIIRQPYSYLMGQSPGILMKKIASDVGGYVSGLLVPLLDVVARTITVVCLTIALMLIDLRIAIGATAALAMFYVVTFILLGSIRKLATTGMREAGREGSKNLIQMLWYMKTIKVFNAESYFVEKYSVSSERMARLQAQVPVFSNAPRYLVEPACFGGVVVLVLIFSASDEGLVKMLPTLGVMALAGYRILPAMQLLFSQLSTIHSSKHTLDEVYDEFIAAELANTAGNPFQPGYTKPSAICWKHSIRLENICFGYPNAESKLFDGLTLEIKKNEAVAFVGETGSGKSTLVDLIMGLHQPSLGRIIVDGKTIGEDSMAAWREGIGYVPQDLHLLDDTLLRNIAFGLPDEAIDKDRAREAAKTAQILNFITQEADDGFETMAGDRGMRLSGGQKQRIALARALYRNPGLLVLDEATSALDEETEKAVVEGINAIRGTLTLIVVAHRLSTIRQCDRVFRLSRGKIEECTDFQSVGFNHSI
jgi:ABC-type multidrug transport system fused ATPase/permease subunit